MISTDRLTIRKFTELDDGVLKALSTDRANYIPETRDIYPYYDSYPGSGTGWLAVEEREQRQVIGRAGLLARGDLFEPFEYELAYVITPEFRRKGYAGEAAQGLASYAADILKVNRFFCGIALTNTASIRIAQKIGLSEDYHREWYGVDHVFFWYRRNSEDKNEIFRE